ncbi:MAG: S8/S53 family peptidase, partial [bacterium]|nr:S8/S53 family peptidase [bacterium]
MKVVTVVVLCVLLTCVVGGGLSCDGGGGSTAGDETPRLTAAGPAGGGGIGGGGGQLNFGEGGEGAGTEEAGPTVEQSIFDYTQTGLAPWGPVVATQQYLLGGQTLTANQLSHPDPFTGLWQLSNGDIVITNAPLTQVVNTPSPQPLPAHEIWIGPDGAETVASNQVLVSFTPACTQTIIEQFLTLNNLEVILSWFEVAEEGSGNEIAVFHLSYPASTFTTFAAAYAFFSAQPLLEACIPNSLDSMNLCYQEGLPQDVFCQANQVQQLDIFNVDSGNFLSMGPPDGSALSRVGTAVMDQGVFRTHEDFTISTLAQQRKVSWLGMQVTDEAGVIGWMLGAPETLSRIHGTQCAGTMTSTTRSTSAVNSGSAGLAPRNGVFPIRLRFTDDDSISHASLFAAIAAMRFTVGHGTYYEDIRVVNMSFGRRSWDAPGGNKLLGRLFDRDVKKFDRLYVGGAGNGHIEETNFPAACDSVLGVAGAWT